MLSNGIFTLINQGPELDVICCLTATLAFCGTFTSVFWGVFLSTPCCLVSEGQHRIRVKHSILKSSKMCNG